MVSNMVYAEVLILHIVHMYIHNHNLTDAVCVRAVSPDPIDIQVDYTYRRNRIPVDSIRAVYTVVLQSIE